MSAHDQDDAAAGSGGDAQTPPAGASAGGPSGTAMGSPGGLPAAITDKLPVDAELLDSKPEILVGGAFAAGFLAARVLRRVGGA